MPRDFTARIGHLKAQGRYRRCSISDSGIDFTSNDYLAFAQLPILQEAAISFFQAGGAVGSAASRLLRGYMDEHSALEKFAQTYFSAPSALFFISGFQANYTLLTTIADRGDVVIFDSLIHASSRDGVQASLAKHIRAEHNDLSSYELSLKKAKEMARGQIYIAVESVYSMDGDEAPLAALYELACAYDAILIIDEAHGVGVSGPNGKGLSESLVEREGYERIITVHTCGKALGAAGALICGREDIIDYMINAGRGFIYSTASMPVQAHIVRKSLELLQAEQGIKQRQKLSVICKLAKELLGGHGTHIVPVMIGDDAQALRVSQAMQDKGYDVRAIRYPTVPKGSARLRVSLNADLSEEDLRGFCEALSLLLKSEAA